MQFGFLGTTVPEQWRTAMGLWIVGYIMYGITLVFYASIFPRLARNTQRTKDARAKLDSGESSPEEYEKVEMLERNRLSNISTAHSNCECRSSCPVEDPILNQRRGLPHHFIAQPFDLNSPRRQPIRQSIHFDLHHMLLDRYGYPVVCATEETTRSRIPQE